MEAMSIPRSRDSGAVEGRRRLAELLAGARQEFTADIERGLGGRAAQARFSDRIDELLRGIVEKTRAHTPMRFAVVALGGYGRRALCLHSDVDLLIILDGKIAAGEERFVKSVLHPLWDLHLSVGHQVLGLTDAAAAKRDDAEFLLALVDARLLAGDPAVFAAALHRFRGPREAWRESVLAALLQLTDRRHAEYNDTIYQLEPDVKDSPGGLRDVSAARVLASLADAATTPEASAAERLDEAEDFLLRLRALLHLLSRRNHNVLSHDLQEKVAEYLRCPGAESQQRVESLMGAYFRRARVVARALHRTRRAVCASQPERPRESLGDNLELTRFGVGFADERRAAADPASWLRVFELALQRGLPVADRALTLFERYGARHAAADYLDGPAGRRRLLDFLRPRPGLYDRLSEMNDCGLLERVLPEFQAISCRVIRDFYHKYTVDEHTLLAVRGIERLLSPGQPSRQRFSSILGELHSPELLVLALLLHDVGKWKDDNHAEESVRMAQAALGRLEVAPEGRHDVEFLIANHLEMSRAAFRRDSEDPAVVRQLASLVGTEQRLKMLCLMTLVDMEAVGAGTLTPWREELLWRLYVDTYNRLTHGYGDEIIERGQTAVAALQAGRPADLTEGELARFLEGFPQRYLALFEPEQIYRHARLSRGIEPNEVHLLLEQKDDIWELAVVTLDKPFLFSNISGVLSYFGMDILRGGAMTSPAGLVLDIFQFTDEENFFRLNPGAFAEFEELMKDVVAGRQDVTALLRRKESGFFRRRGPRRVVPVVYFDNESSARYTILEIVAQDALGLLHRMSSVISRQGCNVDLVLISTEGNRAIDVFHVTKAGAKLAEPDQRALKRELERILEEGP